MLPRSRDSEFKAELKALLAKYSASISFECGESSDLHGIYNPRISAWVDKKEIVLTNGFETDSKSM